MKTNSTSYRGYRFPPEIISHGVWLYHRGIVNLSEIRGKRRDLHDKKPRYSGVLFLGLTSMWARIGSS
jgi:hypothetical protein